MLDIKEAYDYKFEESKKEIAFNVKDEIRAKVSSLYFKLSQLIS